MKLVFSSDHAGFKLRQHLAGWARLQGHEVTEVGAPNEQPYDYPIAADLAVDEILANRAEMGVMVCGSGIGISIRANRHKGIRAAHCLNEPMTMLARQHNHANVLCLGEREVPKNTALTILQTFLDTSGDEAERHVRRVCELDAPLEEELERTK